MHITRDVQQRRKREGTGIATYVREKALGYNDESFLVPGHPFVLADLGCDNRSNRPTSGIGWTISFNLKPSSRST